MIRTAVLSFSLLALMGVPAMAVAQDGIPVTAEAAMDDTALKMDLAKKMHEIRPARMQVQEAVKQASRNLQPLEQDKFIKMVDRAFDYDKLEELSVATMVKIFTTAELQKMVDYFGSPEAKAIGDKLPQYQMELHPEIIKMLDAAMMTEKTGGAADTPVLTAPVEAEKTP